MSSPHTQNGFTKDWSGSTCACLSGCVRVGVCDCVSVNFFGTELETQWIGGVKWNSANNLFRKYPRNSLIIFLLNNELHETSIKVSVVSEIGKTYIVVGKLPNNS